MLYLEVVKEELLYSERTESWGTAGNLPGKSAKPHMRISRLPLKTPSFLSCSHSLVVPLSLTYNTHTVTHMQRSQMYAWMHALRQQTLVQAQTCTLECQVCVDAVITQTEKKKFRRTSLRLWKECWSFSFSPPVTHSSPFCCSTLNPPFTFPTAGRLWFLDSILSALHLHDLSPCQKLSELLLSWKCSLFDQMTLVLAESITDPHNQPPSPPSLAADAFPWFGWFTWHAKPVAEKRIPQFLSHLSRCKAVHVRYSCSFYLKQ